MSFVITLMLKKLPRKHTKFTLKCFFYLFIYLFIKRMKTFYSSSREVRMFQFRFYKLISNSIKRYIAFLCKFEKLVSILCIWEKDFSVSIMIVLLLSIIKHPYGGCILLIFVTVVMGTLIVQSLFKFKLENHKNWIV